MKGRKVIDFILLRPALTQKNFTTVIIVLGLMGAYMLVSGQKSFNLPSFDSEATFGVGDVGKPTAMSKEQAQEILGVSTTSDREQRLNNIAARDPLIGRDYQSDIEPVNHDLGYNFDQQHRKEESQLQKYELRKKDSLDTIAERLNLKK